MGWDITTEFDVARGRFGVISGNGQFPVKTMFLLAEEILKSDDFDLVEGSHLFQPQDSFYSKLSTAHRFSCLFFFVAPASFRSN